MKLKPSPILLPFQEFRDCVKWWEAKPEKEQIKLAKKEDLQNYADLLAYWKEQKK